MKDMKILGAFGLVIALLWGMFYFGIGPAAGFTCDQGSIDAMKLEDPARSAAYQAAFDQLCKPGKIDQSDTRDVDNDDADTDESDTGNQDTPQADDPFTKVTERYSWLRPYTVEQIVTWDVNDKVSLSSGGPYFAIHPDLWGKDLADLTSEEMVKEAKFRLAFSPASLASNGAMFGYWSYDQEVVDAKVASYLSDVDKWKADVEMVSEHWNLELEKGIEKYKEETGSFTAVFFYVVDGVPYVRIDKTVDRTSEFWAFKFSDGTILRAACGGNQEYWWNDETTSTDEKVDDVEPIALPPVEHNQEGTPVEGPGIEAPASPSATPSVEPSASPSAPSSEPASASPTPTPSPTPSSTPSTPPAETCTWEDGSEHPLNSQGDCPKDQGADQADGVEEPADNPSTPSAEPTPEPNEAPLEPSTGTDDADAGTDGNAGAEDVPEQDQGGDGSIADS